MMNLNSINYNHLNDFVLFFHAQKYVDLKMELSRTERHILKEMGFICHVEHPHKFISNYLATLETPPELRQEAWNLANDRYIICGYYDDDDASCVYSRHAHVIHFSLYSMIHYSRKISELYCIFCSAKFWKVCFYIYICVSSLNILWRWLYLDAT